MPVSVPGNNPSAGPRGSPDSRGPRLTGTRRNGRMPRALLPDRAKIVLMPKHPPHDPIVDCLTQSRDVLQAAIDDPHRIETMAAIVDRMTAAPTAGDRILPAGKERLLPRGEALAAAAE
jgi:hypothetical protein